MTISVSIVDAFTDVPFRGNPAGVVILREPRDAAWMQDVASELKHSETAFVVVPETVAEKGAAAGATTRDGADEPLPLRWFTPVAEVDLCGHATLAAAHVLGGHRTFSTRSGLLHCVAEPDGRVEMDFPADPQTPVEVTPAILACLDGATPVSVTQGREDYLVRLADVETVRSLAPDLAAVAALPGARGLIVTAADGPASIVSRCFFPAYGIPEDPVTGSAHCTLASFWSPLLGVTELEAEQASERGGRLRLRIEGERVHLSGHGVTVLSGTLNDGW
ncbi:PhzF family phenazine biosynthesis protein [Catenulispora subtropica]|uniref:PhzF family phenazine biosynthesis protein n=1 Tax=Catenulispora subtropica TaxID=450798 RepID=A0ABN2SCB4_9ACTN